MALGWSKRRRDKQKGQAASEAEEEQVRFRRTLLREEVTSFGEQLAELHITTLGTPLVDDIARDYQAALDRYEQAKGSVRDIATPSDALRVEEQLDEGRFRIACVLARQAGEPLPERLPACFFDPQHGMATTMMLWTPRGGVERMIPICGSDARRLEADESPAIRLVRVGDRMVPWFEQDAARSLLADYAPDYDSLKNAHRDRDRFLGLNVQPPNPFGDGPAGGAG